MIAKHNNPSKSQPGLAEAKIIKKELDASIASDPPDEATMRHDQLVENQVIIKNQNDVTHHRLQSIENKIDQILPQKKQFHKAVVDRDPVPNKLLEEIISNTRPKGCHTLSWARFQLTCVLLPFGGLTINEVPSVTEERLKTLIETKRLPFYQNKVKTILCFVFTQ